MAVLPKVPTTQESGFPEVEAGLWLVAVVHSGTPRGIVDRISQDIASVVAMPDFRERLSAQGAELIGSTPEEFSSRLRAEIATWGKVIKAAGLKGK